MRKLFNTILALAAGITLLVSCQDKADDNNFATSLQVDKTEIILESAGASATVTLTANGDWVAVAPDWLQVSPGAGFGNAVLTVSAPDNLNDFDELMGPRGQVLYIYGEGTSVQVAIRQNGLDALDATRVYTKITSLDDFDTPSHDENGAIAVIALNLLATFACLNPSVNTVVRFDDANANTVEEQA